jgi:hypothetical protein
MKTDKELAMQLVDSREEYYLRYTPLETILDAAKVPGWASALSRCTEIGPTWNREIRPR